MAGEKKPAVKAGSGQGQGAYLRTAGPVISRPLSM